MRLERRVSKLEQTMAPEDNGCFTCVWCDDKGVLKDEQGNILTEKPSGNLLILREGVYP